jgi:LacI family transcriptional regulator
MTHKPPAAASPPASDFVRGHKRAATIHDVAKRAGVSPMTVSRVVNDGKNVRETTRAAVMVAIRELNYAPNPAARSLAGSESVRVGLLYSNPSAAYLSEFLVGVLDESSRKATQITLEKCDVATSAQVAAVRKLIAGGIEAVILPPPLCESEALLEELKVQKLPVMAVACGRYNPKAICVRIDDMAAAFEMTNYLLELGHRRIGFIRGHPNLSASAEREKGFVKALQEAEIPLDAALTAQGYFTYRSGMEAAERLLLASPRPTAIFASNDDMAAGAISVAHRKGLDVPGNLSVVGFDDSSIATTVWPELTTIHQPISAMAEIALDLACRAVCKLRSGGEPKAINHQVSYSRVERESAAPPKV